MSREVNGQHYDAEKVLVYVLDQTISSVLAFTQQGCPEAGVQVPAGTVEDGEEPVAAAARELREESGLELRELPNWVGTVLFEMYPYKFERHLRHIYWCVTDIPKTESWTNIEAATATRGPVVANFEFLSVDSATTELVAGHGDLLRAAVGIASKRSRA